MKTRQMMMVDSVYLDEPRMYYNGVSWVHLGVYFGVLLFRFRYESMSLKRMKVSHFIKR